MANTQGSQQGSGTRTNQDPAQKSGSGQHNQQGNQGNKDMNEERQGNRGGQGGSGQQSGNTGTGSGQHSGGSRQRQSLRSIDQARIQRRLEIQK